MKKELVTDIDRAMIFMKSKDLTLFEQTLTQSDNNGLFNIVLLYYSAKGQLLRKIGKKESISDLELSNFEKNRLRLDNLKQEVETEPLTSLTKKYNEAIILSALVQSIRDNEANIISHSKYLELKEKFYSWPKIGIKSQKILLSWKTFSNAIKEVEEWLDEKKNAYLPTVEKLIALFEANNDVTTNELYTSLQDIPEKESYYILCNVLLTNPILRKDFLSISMLSGEKLLKFERTLYSVLSILDEKTHDNTLRGLIILFRQQINIQRPELV